MFIEMTEENIDKVSNGDTLYQQVTRQDLFVTAIDPYTNKCKIGERLILQNGHVYGRVILTDRKQLESLKKQIDAILLTNIALKYKKYME